MRRRLSSGIVSWNSLPGPEWASGLLDGTRLVEDDLAVRRIAPEVRVSGEDRNVETLRHGADQKVDRGGRDAVSPADVEEPCRLVVVGGRDLEIAEVAEALLDRE